jgi:hypothetical protein
MTKTFCDHLIYTTQVIAELDLHRMDAEERAELVELIDEIFHHHALNVIFNHLPKQFHDEFTDLLSSHPHDPRLIDYLKTKITIDIESEILTQSTRVKNDLLTEIKRAKIKR